MTDQRTYTAAPGARLRDEDAEIIGPVIDRLARERGAATARNLLSEAKDPASPIHRYFEWDDEKAAEAHRLERARLLIRSIRIVVETTDAPIETRAFHVTTSAGQTGYRSASVVFADEDMSAQVIKTALRELAGWRLRYQQYRKVAQLAPIFEVIDGALDSGASNEPIAAE